MSSRTLLRDEIAKAVRDDVMALVGARLAQLEVDNQQLKAQVKALEARG